MDGQTYRPKPICPFWVGGGGVCGWVRGPGLSDF